MNSKINILEPCQPQRPPPNPLTPRPFGFLILNSRSLTREKQLSRERTLLQFRFNTILFVFSLPCQASLTREPTQHVRERYCHFFIRPLYINLRNYNELLGHYVPDGVRFHMLELSPISSFPVVTMCRGEADSGTSPGAISLLSNKVKPKSVPFSIFCQVLQSTAHWNLAAISLNTMADCTAATIVMGGTGTKEMEWCTIDAVRPLIVSLFEKDDRGTVEPVAVRFPWW